MDMPTLSAVKMVFQLILVFAGYRSKFWLVIWAIAVLNGCHIADGTVNLAANTSAREIFTLACTQHLETDPQPLVGDGRSNSGNRRLDQTTVTNLSASAFKPLMADDFLDHFIVMVQRLVIRQQNCPMPKYSRMPLLAAQSFDPALAGRYTVYAGAFADS